MITKLIYRILILLLTLLSASICVYNQSLHTISELYTSGGTMGVYQSLYLLDYRSYSEKALPAYLAYKERRDFEPLVNLLKEIRDNLRSYKKIKGFWVDNSRRDYQTYIDVLSEHLPQSSGDDRSPPKIKIEPDYLDTYIKETVAGAIVGVACIPRRLKFTPVLEIGRSPLFPYIEKKDSWVTPVILPPPGVRLSIPPSLAQYIHHGGSGEILEFHVEGSGSERMYTRDELVIMHSELSKINPHERDTPLQLDYDILMNMLELCLNDPTYKLVWLQS